MDDQLNASIKDMPIPPKMRKLPISDKGFPVPWFVAWLDASGELTTRGNGTPEFRCIYPGAVEDAFNSHKCWLCGERLGVNLVFVLGPMCIATRTTSEPPCHMACAEYAVQACPFLVNPRAKRNEKNLPDEHYQTEGYIARNPGVIALYTTNTYTNHGTILEIGEPIRISWWRERRAASRTEIIESIESGVPLLEAEAVKQGFSKSRVAKQVKEALKLVPA